MDINELSQHPAARAWFESGARRAAPTRIVALKEHKSNPWEKKSAVYRLEGSGPGGLDVVAKRCRKTTAVVEKAIYEEILPSIGVPALAYHGYIDEEDSAFCWIFLEDARGVEFERTIEEHRVAAGQWLGHLHAATHHLEGANSLPDRGPAHYLGHLESGHDRLLHIVENPALKASDTETLRTLIGDLELLRTSWDQIEAFCARAPSALVHGDFVPKNIRIRQSGAGLGVVPFDWEAAGWGPAATDLGAGTNPELGVYLPVVKAVWPSLCAEVVERMVRVGSVFRLTASIDWDGGSFSSSWPERTMWSMLKYRARLHDLLENASWNN